MSLAPLLVLAIMTEDVFLAMRLLAAALVGASIAACVPARADLGAADVGKTRQLSGATHEAYCGANENIKCKITFESGRLKVDGSRGIEPYQVKEIYFSQKLFRDYGFAKKGALCVGGFLGARHCHVHIEIKYSPTLGKMDDSWATFRFENLQSSLIFKSDIEAWSGEPLRAVGPSVKVVE